MQALQNIVPRLRGALSPGRGRGPHKQQVQIMSDLHLEIGQQYETFDFSAAGRFLVLAGDIGRLVDYEGYRGFLERQAGRFERVFLVLGNHEFFGLGYEEGIARAEQLAREPALRGGLVLLNRGVWVDEGASGSVIMGCTLWSHVPDPARAVIESKVSDFRKIEGWSVDRHNQVHGEEAAWLASELQSLSEGPDKINQGRNILVVTHHAPSLTGTSAPEHAGNPWTPAFATDLLPNKLQTGRVKTWVFGHTHHTTDLCCGGVRLVANQRGYVFPGSKPNTTTTTTQNTKTTRWPWTRKIAVTHQFDPERVVEL